MAIERFEDLKSWQEALDGGFVSQKEFDEAYRQADAVGRLINGMLNNLDRQVERRAREKPAPRGKSR